MTFRLFLDEDVGFEVARRLRAAGMFDVLTTPEAGRASLGHSDESQLEYAAVQSRVLFSFNMQDYERIAKRWAVEGQHHAGIVSSPRRPEVALVSGFRELALLYPDGFPPDLCMRLPRGEL